MNGVPLGRRERPVHQDTGPLAGACGGEHHVHAGVHLLHVGAESGLVELGGPGEIGLGDQHQLGQTEPGGVLERLVLTLGDVEARTTRSDSPRS
ncbi:hypothetical protein SHIRM173S_10317 [Streptomyces hirsutus]